MGISWFESPYGLVDHRIVIVKLFLVSNELTSALDFPPKPEFH